MCLNQCQISYNHSMSCFDILYSTRSLWELCLLFSFPPLSLPWKNFKFLSAAKPFWMSYLVRNCFPTLLGQARLPGSWSRVGPTREPLSYAVQHFPLPLLLIGRKCIIYLFPSSIASLIFITFKMHFLKPFPNQPLGNCIILEKIL